MRYSTIISIEKELERLKDDLAKLDTPVTAASFLDVLSAWIIFLRHASQLRHSASLRIIKQIGLSKDDNDVTYKAPVKTEDAALFQAAPPPPPETFGAYVKKGGESGGVINMMDMMIQDLDKEITEIEVEEKEAQKEYEQLLADSADKRATDSKAIEDKEGAKADLEARLLKDEESKTVTMKEAMATHQFLADVHADCDWLLSNFEARKQARAGEIDALTKGKAVLSGADFSLLQRSEVHRHI
jgi:hypothetical protein